MIFNDVSKPDLHCGQSPFSVVLSKDCTLSEGVSSVSVVDAQSIFDTLSKNSAGSRADRSSSIELGCGSRWVGFHWKSS